MHTVKRKYSTSLLIFLTSCGIALSCKSPNPSEPAQLNAPPLVTLSLNRDTLEVGDTLRVAIHASDPTLVHGSLDLKDGTVYTFSQLGHIFDTTIVHIYSQTGVYSVVATFGDGDTSTSVFTTVSVTHFFALSFSVGETWRYSYSYSSTFTPTMAYDYRSGIHEWKILSYNMHGDDTIYTIQQIRDDTREYYDPTNGQWTDTTYRINDTTQFSIQVSFSSIHFSWPLARSVRYDSIPNHVYLGSVRYSIGDAWYTGFTLYDDLTGPLEYARYYLGPYGSDFSESFSLVYFWKP